MMTFLEFLDESKQSQANEAERGRPPKNKFRKQDLEYMKKNEIAFSPTSSTMKINALKKRLIDRINAKNKELLAGIDDRSLDDLDTIVRANRVPELPPKEKHDWQKAEAGIMKGLNQLFTSKFFSLVRKDGKHRKLDEHDLKAELAGGSQESDIRIVNLWNNKAAFYVECKLDF